MTIGTRGSKPGRKPKAGLLLHKQWGYYKRYQGRPKYFGKDEQEAYGRWLDYERGLLINPFVEALTKQEEIRQSQRSMIDQLLDMSNKDDPAQVKDTITRLANILFPENKSIAKIVEVEPPKPKTTSTGPTIETACNLYTDYFKRAYKKHSSIRDAEHAFTHFLNFLGDNKRIADLTRADFTSWRDHLYQQLNLREEAIAKSDTPTHLLTTSEIRNLPGYSSSYVSNLIANVRGGFRRVKKEHGWQLPESDWLELLQTKQGTKVKAKALTAEEFKQLLKVADYRGKAMLLFGLNFAARNVDIGELKWKHIDFDNKIVHFNRGKQLGQRHTKLWNRTIKALNKIRTHSEYCFVTDKGLPMVRQKQTADKQVSLNRQDIVGRAFAKLCLDAGLTVEVEGKDKPLYGFGVLAKSAATAAEQAGCPRNAIEMLLGDASSGAWRFYANSCPESVQAAVDAIEAHYFG